MNPGDQIVRDELQIGNLLAQRLYLILIKLLDYLLGHFFVDGQEEDRSFPYSGDFSAVH